MKVITLTNEKGGEGKTSLAVNIAAIMALQGKRVLLLDGDAQGHCARRLKLPKTSGLYDLLVRDAEWNQVIVVPQRSTWAGTKEPMGSLMLLPSNEETRVIPMMVSDPLALRERLEEMSDSFDVAVLDTPPTPSMLHTLLYMASDFILCPTQCEELSLDGLNGATKRVSNQNAARESLGIDERVHLMGIIPTMYTNTLAHRHGLALLQEYSVKNFGNAEMIWKPIAQRTIWSESAYAHKSLYAYAPDHAVTAEMVALVDRVCSYV